MAFGPFQGVKGHRRLSYSFLKLTTVMTCPPYLPNPRPGRVQWEFTKALKHVCMVRGKLAVNNSQRIVKWKEDLGRRKSNGEGGREGRREEGGGKEGREGGLRRKRERKGRREEGEERGEDEEERMEEGRKRTQCPKLADEDYCHQNIDHTVTES